MRSAWVATPSGAERSRGGAKGWTAIIGGVGGGRDELREAGELLGVETVDRTGLVVTSEGAFVRIFRVAPVNPLLMSGQEREKTAATFARLISQLHAEESIQILVEGRPVDLAELVGECRREVQAIAGPPPTPEVAGGDSLAVSRWRLHGALEESLRLHAEQSARASPSKTFGGLSERQRTDLAARLGHR